MYYRCIINIEQIFLRKHNLISDFQPQRYTDFERKDILKYFKKIKVAMDQERYKLAMYRKIIEFLFK